jgi:RNA ligase partner protein
LAKMLRQRFVLDTTALTDSLAWEGEGCTNICEGMNAILDCVAEARLHLGISCYIPYPSVYNEIRDFVRHNECDEAVLIKVDTWLVKMTPDRYEVKIPSKVFYEYVFYMRSRINKGMNVAEEAIWEAVGRCIALSASGGDLTAMKDEIEREAVGGLVRKFREKYRNALRYGILDSAPDIDILLLAKELNAAVISQDLGVQRWAEQLGLRYLEARTFPVMIKEYLSRARAIQKSDGLPLYVPPSGEDDTF